MPSHKNTLSSPPLSNGLHYEHPYLSSQHEEKKELGMFDLFFFKMFRCFVPDNLPPPNPNAPIHQQNKRSSSLTADSKLHLRHKRESHKSASTFSTISITRESPLETFSVPAAAKAAPPKRRVVSHTPSTSIASENPSSTQRPASEMIPRHATISASTEKSGRVSAISAMFENKDE